MNNDDWKAAIKKLMDSADTTAANWDLLLRETEVAARSNVGDWHVQQTLGMFASFLCENDAGEEGAKLNERIADDAEEQIRYWHGAAAQSLAFAANHHFENGNRDHAVALAKRALSHFGHAADSPTPIFEKLLAQMRTYFENQRANSE